MIHFWVNVENRFRLRLRRLNTIRLLMTVVGLLRSAYSIHSTPYSASRKTIMTYFYILFTTMRRLYRNPFDPNERMVKRLIAVGGDWVRPLGSRHDILRVPQGCCWVEGDNPRVSGDSNQFGPVRIFLSRAGCCCASPVGLIQKFTP